MSSYVFCKKWSRSVEINWWTRKKQSVMIFSGFKLSRKRLTRGQPYLLIFFYTWWFLTLKLIQTWGIKTFLWVTWALVWATVLVKQTLKMKIILDRAKTKTNFTHTCAKLLTRFIFIAKTIFNFWYCWWWISGRSSQNNCSNTLVASDVAELTATVGV